MRTNARRRVGIVLFDEVEVLDFTGPLEVFAVAQRSPVTARNRLVVVPTHTFQDAPVPEVLVVPGGAGVREDGTPQGTHREMHNEVLLDYLRQRLGAGALMLSVCTGALLLARAGLLDGRQATTHHLAYELLRAAAPVTVVEGVKRVGQGRVVTAGGISAGIDMSLGVLARLLGEDRARATAADMEYQHGAISGQQNKKESGGPP